MLSHLLKTQNISEWRWSKINPYLLLPTAIMQDEQTYQHWQASPSHSMQLFVGDVPSNRSFLNLIEWKWNVNLRVISNWLLSEILRIRGPPWSLFAPRVRQFLVGRLWALLFVGILLWIATGRIGVWEPLLLLVPAAGMSCLSNWGTWRLVQRLLRNNWRRTCSELFFFWWSTHFWVCVTFCRVRHQVQ